jgi:elongator complex protein 3
MDQKIQSTIEEYFARFWEQRDKIKSWDDLGKKKRALSAEFALPMIKNSDLLKVYKDLLEAGKIEAAPDFINILKKRQIRTLSGVAPIAVLTRFQTCPGNCLFCPTEKAMPKSYLSNEPAVMRAIKTDFDPFLQVRARIFALTNNGHEANKIELIVMGGSWSAHPVDYQEWFLKRCFDAANSGLGEELDAKNLAEAQKINETADFRIVGMTLETRPDLIDEDEVKRMRVYGCTRVEMGVQHLSDEILSLNKRGHGTAETIRATKLLKEAGFKVTYHLMPNLYGSDPEQDLQMFKELFINSDYQPDQLKIYPTVVTKGSELYDLWQAGKYQPYDDETLKELLLKIKLVLPRYTRVIRLIRDIPAESIEAGNKMSNLREVLQTELKKLGQQCLCIRCREAKDQKFSLDDLHLYSENYEASGGQEKFLWWGSPDKNTLYAFVRLRFNGDSSVCYSGASTPFFPELQGAALICELHTYGKLIPPKQQGGSAVQHFGLGKALMLEAERLAKEAGYKKIAVISGIGVREYYRKLGYRLEGTYMVKGI